VAILVTGGAGFIGSSFVRQWCAQEENQEVVINLDMLTYAGNIRNLENLPEGKHIFVHGDIGDADLIQRLLEQYRPTSIVNFAAESHVDRSIQGCRAFLQTNVLGTGVLLECAKNYWAALGRLEKDSFRFLHVSTDEVFGALALQEAPFHIHSPYAPRNPYSASKAASDHLVRSYYHTFGLPIIISNCSNNYGPHQFPEKLIPLVILRCLSGQTIPIYGQGEHIRDWLFVEDHCRALCLMLEKGVAGQTYLVGGQQEISNMSLVTSLCVLLDQKRPQASGQSYTQNITFVQDRPGHDQRYAIDISKIQQELGWHIQTPFHKGLEITVDWYLENTGWMDDILAGEYRTWVQKHYCLGSKKPTQRNNL
jgi:dTDP-glucose 4,6-dehydratase